ncbi:MAG TPA: thiamine pyrophosphate-dependent enzyme [Armatimonadota bacterium]|jgi:2-oxoglutarate ferredoxin oxidoreductase subunit beta
MSTDTEIMNDAGLEPVYTLPESMERDIPMRYCPGCTHPLAHRLCAEVLEELGITDRTVLIASVGCSVFANEFFTVDGVQASHGRAPAVATGVKRVHPDNIVFTYQGDGDLASIGMAETIHAAARGEQITIVFLNNGVYGMTKGQMAPTTLIGQKTTTSPYGRSAEDTGYPIDVCALLATLPGVSYLARETLIAPKYVMRAKRALKKAFQYQIDGKGFGLVELLSICPAWWYMDSLQAFERMEAEVLPQYPLGTFVEK